MVISTGKTQSLPNKFSHEVSVKGRQPQQEKRIRESLSTSLDRVNESSIQTLKNNHNSIHSQLREDQFNSGSENLSKKELNSAYQSKMKRNTISQAEMHIQKMPTVIDDGKLMAVWTDIKEIIFPSCSDAHCDIVLNVIKEILDYPEEEVNASPCTPKQQMAFLRNFRIVPCGTLLVNTCAIQEKIQILKSMVRTRHITSEGAHSRDCHYAKEHTSHDNLMSPDRHVTSEFQKMKSLANNHFCWCVLPWACSQDKDIAKAARDFEPIVYNGRYLIPAMKLGSRPYAPMSLIQPYFRQFYSYLFDLSRDHLVGAGSEMTRCLSLLEANCVSSYIARQQGWGARWRHITTRDLMIDWQKLCKHVKNPPPALSTESTDLSNNVAMVTPLQMLYDTENDISNYSITNDLKQMKWKGQKTESHNNETFDGTETVIFNCQDINKTEIKNAINERFAQNLAVAMVNTRNSPDVSNTLNDDNYMSKLNEYAMQLATENIKRKQGSELLPENIDNQQSVSYFYIKHPAGDRILKVKVTEPGSLNTSGQNQSRPQQEVHYINNQPIGDQYVEANQNVQNYCTSNCHLQNDTVLLNNRQENLTFRDAPRQQQTFGSMHGRVLCQDNNGKKVVLLSKTARGDNIVGESAKLKSEKGGVILATPKDMTQKVTVAQQKPAQFYVRSKKSSLESQIEQPRARENNILEETDRSLKVRSTNSGKSNQAYGAQTKLQTILEQSIKDEQYPLNSNEQSSNFQHCISNPLPSKTILKEHRTGRSERCEECTGNKERSSKSKHHAVKPNKQMDKSQKFSTSSTVSSVRLKHQTPKSGEHSIDNSTSNKQNSQQHGSLEQQVNISDQAHHDNAVNVEKRSDRCLQLNESQIKPTSSRKEHAKHQEKSVGKLNYQLDKPGGKGRNNQQSVSKRVKSAGDHIKNNTADTQNELSFVHRRAKSTDQEHGIEESKMIKNRLKVKLIGNVDLKDKELKTLKKEKAKVSADEPGMAKEREIDNQEKTIDSVKENINGVLSQKGHGGPGEIQGKSQECKKKFNTKLTESQRRSVARRAVVLPTANQKSQDILDKSRRPNSSARILPCTVVDVVGSIIEDSLSSQKRLEKLSGSTAITRNNAVSRDAPYREILFENYDKYLYPGENHGIMSLVSASPFAPDSLHTWRLLNEYDRKSISSKSRNQNHVAMAQSINRNEKYKPKTDCVEDQVHLPIISKSCALLPSNQRKMELKEKPRKSISTPLLAADIEKYRVKCQDLKLTFYKLQKNKSEKTKAKKTLGNTSTLAKKVTNISTDRSKSNTKITTKSNKNQKAVSKESKSQNPTHQKSKVDQSVKRDGQKKEATRKASNHPKKTVSVSSQVEKCKRVITKKKTKGRKSKKDTKKDSENSESNLSWIVDDSPQKSFKKRERRTKNNTDSVAEDDLQDIIQQEWALQGSVFVLTDEKGQGDKRILRRSLRSVLTPNKPKLSESCDDQESERRTSKSFRKGRRRKPKFKLPDVIISDESSGDSLYDPQLKSVNHADILIPKSFLSIQSDSSTETSQTNLTNNSEDVLQTRPTESSDDLPDPNIYNNTNQKDFEATGSNEFLNSIENTLKVFDNPNEKGTKEEDSNIIHTIADDKEINIAENDTKAIQLMGDNQKGKRTRDRDILKSSYMNKVIQEQERILQIIKQRASSNQPGTSSKKSHKMVTSQCTKGSNPVDKNNNDVIYSSDAEFLPQSRNTSRVVLDENQLPSDIVVKDENVEHLKESGNRLNGDALCAEETADPTFYFCDDGSDIAGKIGDDVLIVKIKEENVSDVDNARDEGSQYLKDIDYCGHLPVFCPSDKNFAYIKKQIYDNQTYRYLSENESHQASENESNCSLFEIESKQALSENQKECSDSETKIVNSDSESVHDSANNILLKNFTVEDCEEICGDEDVIYIISDGLDSDASVLFLENQGDEVQDPMYAEYKNVFEWVQSEFLEKREILAECGSSTGQIDKAPSSSDNCLMPKEDFKFEEEIPTTTEACYEVSSIDDFGRETVEDVASIVPENCSIASGLQDIMVSQSTGSSNNSEDNETISMANGMNLEENTEKFSNKNSILPESIKEDKFQETFFGDERRQVQLYEGELKSMSSLTIPAISGESSTSATLPTIGGEKWTSNTTLSVIGGDSFTSTGTESAKRADSNTSNLTTSTFGEGTSSNFSAAAIGTKKNILFESDSDFTISSIDSVETLPDWKKEARVTMATDNTSEEIITDSFGIRHIPDYDDSGDSNSGVVLHNGFIIPYVSVNGYKYVVLREVVVLFNDQCQSKCQIPKHVLRRHPGIQRTFCTWEHLYLLDQLLGPQRRAVQTGEMLLRFDSVVSKIEDIQEMVREKHRNTKLKNSQNCNYSVS